MTAQSPAVQSGEAGPEGWKTLDDFAAGIDENRLPTTDALAGRTISITDTGGSARYEFRSADSVSWAEGDSAARDAWYEAVQLRPGLFFLTVHDAADKLRTDIVILHEQAGRVLRVRSQIGEQPTPGRPRVEQQFHPGTIDGAPVSGDEPAPTRDLIGLRALYRYSPNHLYEHVYLSSERYAWQCIVGEQRGHGDVDLASTWKVTEDVYVFTFREFVIPVAATWLYDLAAARTVGTFVGLSADDAVRVSPGGAVITQLGRVSYPDEQPV